MYVPVADERSLASEGKDPAVWVRDLIRYALAKRREKAS